MTDLDLGDVIGKIQPHTRTVSICLDGNLEDERVRLEQALVEARKADDEADDSAYQMQAPAIAEQIEQLQEAAKAVTVDFTFRSIGRESWKTLVAMHPPTKEQIDVATQMDREPLDYNVETFPKTVMLKSLVSPKGVTAERLDELERKLSDGQWQRLWGCCWVANKGTGDVGFSEAASVVVRRMRRNSERPSESESPDPSS